MARTPGAINKSEREHRKDAVISTLKADKARLKAELKAAKKAAKKAK